MEVNVSNSDILNALVFASGIVPSNPITPILTNVKIYSQAGAFVVEATNGDMTGISKISDKNYNFDWQTTVSLSAFLVFIKSIKRSTSSVFSFSKTGETEALQITAGKTKRTIGCLSADGFPRTQDFNEDGANVFEVDSSVLLGLIEKTKISISNNEARPQLNGLFMRLKEEDGVNYLFLVSTDGHRLSLSRAKISQKITHEGVLIPKKAVEEIQKILSRSQGNVKVFITNNKIKIVTSSFVFISKLFEYEFPQYERVIPLANQHILEADTKEFIASVEEVTSVYAGSKETSLKMQVEQNSVKLDAKIGNEPSNSDFDASFSGTQPIEIFYNYNYLLQALKIISSPRVKIFYGEKNAPCLIKPIDSEDYLFVIMPIRT
jgi:DNA polymerase-3 subunit beta